MSGYKYKLYAKTFDTPHGAMAVAVDDQGRVVKVIFPNGFAQWEREIVNDRIAVVQQSERCDAVIGQLDEYFAGKRKTFDVAVQPTGTEFQRRVWAVLQTIPFGTVTTYKGVAQQLGDLAAIRAVGRANATNPIPIIIPCHRVIGADGSLTGFGGGLPLKEALLKLEGSLNRLL
jgi:methylated-DNA-[protein]-cysteine S-methyltransferase